MPQRVEIDGVIHEFPDDFTEADIAAAIGPLPSAATRGMLAQSTLRGDPSWTDRAIEALPMAGGMAGSLAGGTKSNPVGMALAAIGGAGGEGFRQTLEAVRGNWEKVPTTIQAQITQIVEQGVAQGGLEGAGRYILAPLMRIVGRGIYRSALKVPKAVRQEFGAKEVTDTLVREGVPISRTERGSATVEGLLREAGRDTQRTIAAAEANGARPLTMRPIAQSLNRTRGDVANRALRSGPLAEVQEMREALLAENPGRIPLTRGQTMKQAEQDLAIQAYKQEARGAPVNSIATSVHEDIARGLREAIERRVPGVKNNNLRTQRLIGALKAITAAEGRIANRDPVGMGDTLALATGAAGYTAFGPAGVAAGIIQEALTRPELASRLGIAFDRAGKPIVTPQIMRAVSEAVNQLQVGS